MPTRRTRPSLPCLLAVFALTGCAHVRAPEPVRSDEVRIGLVRIALRYAAVDASEAARIRGALPTAVSVAERWGPLPGRITITVHPTHGALEDASRNPGVDWIRAWARRDSVDLQSPRTWSSGGATGAELERLLAHELTHCVMYEAVGGEPRLALGIPAWFREGMATSNAGERFAPSAADAAGALSGNAAFRGEDAPLAYAAAHAGFVDLERRYGRPRIRAVLARVRGGARFARAFEDVLGISLAAFEGELRGAVAVPAGAR